MTNSKWKKFYIFQTAFFIFGVVLVGLLGYFRFDLDSSDYMVTSALFAISLYLLSAACAVANS